MSIFTKILHGVEWFGKEVGKGLAALPRIIRLAEDAEQVAKDALPQVLAVVTDAGELTAAVAKDSGVFLKAFAGFADEISLAAQSKGLDLTKDEAVLTAFKTLVSCFNRANVADVLAALTKLGADTSKLDATVIAGIKKLEADAKV